MFAPFLCLVVSAAPVSLPFARYTLPNGLTVILHEDHSQPRVVVDVDYDVGSANERVGRTGLAHLFEHLMFMGTLAVPNGSFDTLMEQVGGNNNAWTSVNSTNYYEMGPSNLLETFLFLEGDRLAHLPEAMTRAKVDLQRDVVKNERRQSYENRPYGMSEALVSDKLFPPGHPYHHTVIGSHADLTAASVDDVKAFFAKHYVPANAALVIAGDFDPVEAKRLVEKYLAPLPRVEPQLPPVISMVELPKNVRIVHPEAVQHDRVEMHWLAPPDNRRGSAECEVLANLLGGGKSSRLVKSIVIDQRLAEDVDVSFDGRHGQSVFTIGATTQAGHSAAEVEKAIEAELSKLLTSPPTADEVERARARLETRRLTGLEDLSNRAYFLGASELEFGDPGAIARSLLANLDAVTPTGTLEIIRRVLMKPRVTITFVANGKKS